MEDDQWLRAETISGVVAVTEAEQTAPTPVDAYLVCVTGPGVGTTFPLTAAVTIGRDGADVLLTESDVSRHHARISWTPLGYKLEDLRSSNGTMLNGTRVETSAVVKVGDRIQIGRSVFVLSLQDELSKRVARVQRLEAVATLASGIAHDINNSLFVVLANIDALVEDFPALGDRSSTDELRTSANNAVLLAKRLLRLGKVDSLPATCLNVEDLLRRSVAMASRRATAALEVRVDVPSDLTVNGVYEELHHAFLNLFLNAIDAMPRGGQLVITARPTSQDILGSIRPFLLISVADSGCGMDERTKLRIFEPFFTTKPSDKGTGLGLAMIDSTIRKHRGSIEVDSELGKGTTVKVLLPAAVQGE
ncbi:MAG: ATP-binding protein [Kofleriaceae bacterium]